MKEATVGSMRAKVPAAVAAAFLSFFPFSGNSFCYYFLSVSPSCSIGSMVFLCIVLWPCLSGKALLAPVDFLLFSLWNVVLYLGLLASTLGFVTLDLYALGYHFSYLFAAVAALTLLLVFLRSPLAFIFILYIAAFDLRLLPSANFFDYMTDSMLFILSLGYVAHRTLSLFYRPASPSV